MKNLKQVREHKVILAEREEAEDRKLTSLVRAGLFDSKKLPALRRALDKSADKISGQEKRMLVNLLDSLMDQVLSNQSVYQKVKQNVMKEEYEELDESKLDRTTKDINDLPNIIMLRRRAIRTFPGGGKVVMYWADKINRYIPIPVDPINTVTRGPNIDGLSEAMMTPDERAAKRAVIYAKRRAKIGSLDDDDPEAAVQGHKASLLLKRIGKRSGEIEKIRVAAAGKNVQKQAEKEKMARQKQAEKEKMTRLRKKAGGEHGYVSQAINFAKSGQRAAALGTLAGGAIGSLARRMVKEGLETTRIRMKKMSVSPLTGVKKNAVVREDFRAKLEAQRQLDENAIAKGIVTALKYGAKYADDAVKGVSNTVSKYKANRAAAAAEKAAKAAKKEKQLSKIEKSRTRNKEAFKERNKIARDKNALRGKKPGRLRRIGDALAGAAAGDALSGNSNNNQSADNEYKTSRREVARTPGESSFKLAKTGDFATRAAKDAQLQRKAFQTQQNENTIKSLKTISEGETKSISFADGNNIDVGHPLAKKIINIYESLNKNNKQAMANMLDESIDNFKKISKFALDNGN